MLAWLPVLLVEIAPPDPPADLVQLLLQACSQGMRGAECVLADNAQGRDTLGIAIVSWRDDQHTLVQIDVGRRRAEHGHWRTRQIRFQPADTLTERWRTVGFALATLAEDGAEPVEAEPAPAEPQAEAATALAPLTEGAPSREGWSRQTQTKASGSSARVHPSFSAELGFLGGPGLVDQPWRWGTRGRVAWAPWRLPIMATGSASWSMQPSKGQLSARWMGFSVGLGYFDILSSELRLDVAGEFVFEQLAVAATEPHTGAEDHATHSSTGALAHLGAAWPASGPIAATFGLEGCYRRPPAGIWVQGERLGTWSTLGWSFGLGAQWRIY